MRFLKGFSRKFEDFSFLENEIKKKKKKQGFQFKIFSMNYLKA